MSYGFVYLIVNDEMPDVCKIGFTERSPHLRANELSSSTSVPCDFDVLCYIEVENCQAVEALFHRRCNFFRVRPDREFFRFEYEMRARVVGLFKFHDSLAFTLIDKLAMGWMPWSIESGPEIVNPDFLTTGSEAGKSEDESIAASAGHTPSDVSDQRGQL